MKKLISSIIPVVLAGLIVAASTAGEASVTVLDGEVIYGTMAMNTSTSTVELNDMQIATNNGTTTENFNIRGQNSVPGGWVLAGTNGADQYVHGFCLYQKEGDCDEAGDYTALTTDNTPLATGIAASSTVNFHLRITTPTLSTSTVQQSVDVTVQAVETP